MLPPCVLAGDTVAVEAGVAPIKVVYWNVSVGPPLGSVLVLKKVS